MKAKFDDMAPRILKLIEDGPKSPEQIAKALKITPRGATVYLGRLVYMKKLKRKKHNNYQDSGHNVTFFSIRYDDPELVTERDRKRRALPQDLERYRHATMRIGSLGAMVRYWLT